MILAGSHAGAAELERVRTVAQAIARLQHPNIVQIHEVGEHDGLPYFSLEFCAGGSLAQQLAGTPLPPLDAAALRRCTPPTSAASSTAKAAAAAASWEHAMLQRLLWPEIDAAFAKKNGKDGP
jgi:serine/threonine protein kinase